VDAANNPARASGFLPVALTLAGALA